MAASSIELALTPTGHLLIQDGGENGHGPLDAWTRNAAEAFRSGQAEGLLALAATRPDVPPAAAFSFWRDFACLYLDRLCRTPESAGDRLDPIDPPEPADLRGFLESMPPMRGGERSDRPVHEAMGPDRGHHADPRDIAL